MQKRDQFYKEALRFIHETIDVQKIKKDYPVVVIDDEFIRRIKSEKGSRRFYDLLFAVKNYVKEVSDENIVEKVDRIVREWNERKKDVEELYDEMLSIAEYINMERKERGKLRLNEKEYRIFKLLKSHLRVKADDAEIVKAVREIIERVNSKTFPGWFEKSEVVQERHSDILDR